MKYTQYSRKRKGSSAFYIVVALCLVLVGAAAWFAFTRMEEPKIEQNNMSSMESQLNESFDEYEEEFESYIDSEPDASIDSPSSNTESRHDTAEKETASAETQKIKAYTMPVNGEILKDFSLKALQYSATYNDMRIHAAVDIAAAEGTLISAIADGIVKEIENSAEMGKCITVDHGDGLTVKYCGLKNITAEKDTSVRMGDSIGAVGTVPCECSDQSHLHLEAFKDGKAVSILSFFD